MHDNHTESAVAGRPARLALVGDRSPLVQAHARMPDILHALDTDGSSALDAYWIDTVDVADTDFAGFDGVWLLPGSPYVDVNGALEAVRFARVQDIPFLGTCGGFQHLVLEFAHHVCGLTAEHAENVPGAVDPLIRPLTCSLVGEERSVHVVPGTRAAAILGSAPRTERYFCSYGLDQRYVDDLTAAGLVVGGRDDDGEVRLVELTDHQFFLGSLFQPELSSSQSWVHPLIRAFADAVRHQAGRRARQRVLVSPVVSPGAELPGAR